MGINNNNNIDKKSIEDFNESNLSNVIKTTGKEGKILCISLEQNGIGIISHCSLGICSLFGYKKEEIIGQNINILLPDITKELNKEVFIQKIENINQKILKYPNNEGKIRYNSNQLQIYGVHKSKFILPLIIKTSNLFDEEGKINIVCFILSDYSLDLENDLKTSYVLTNQYFII